MTWLIDSADRLVILAKNTLGTGAVQGNLVFLSVDFLVAEPGFPDRNLWRFHG